METTEIKEGREIINIGKNELQNLKDHNKASNFNYNNDENTIRYSCRQKFFAEFIGGIFLLFIGSGVGVYTQGDLVPIALTNGMILGCLVYIFGPISGGHFNPSITVSEFLRKKLTLTELIYYIIAQIVGGFIGSALVALCNRGKFGMLASNQIAQYLITLKDKNNTKIDAWCYICALICEIVLTFFLIILFTFLTASEHHKYNNVNVIIVGASLTMFIFIGFNISGGSLNIMRALPPAVLEAIFGNNNTAIKQIWIYIVWPLVGSIIATYITPCFMR
jgi:aquaporin Z